jgi:hypothetical protein
VHSHHHPLMGRWRMGVVWQATSLGQAFQQVDEMINWRLADDPVDAARPGELDLPKPERANVRCKVSANPRQLYTLRQHQPVAPTNPHPPTIAPPGAAGWEVHSLGADQLCKVSVTQG